MRENLLQLWAWVPQSRLIDLLKEHRNVTHLPGFVELFGKFPFFLCPDHCPIAGRRSPAVMPDEYGVIALSQVFVDQLLRPTCAAKGIFPVDRVKREAARLRIA